MAASSSCGRGLPVALLLLAVAAGAFGCQREPALGGTFESDEALARAVLDGVERRDYDGLLQLAVSKDEFEDFVWPTLPVSRPEVGMPIGFVWGDNVSKSRGYLAETLARHGGRRYELRRVEFDGATTEHGTHTVSRETVLVVRDTAANRERRLRLFGSVIRQDGRSKIFSFIVD